MSKGGVMTRYGVPQELFDKDGNRVVVLADGNYYSLSAADNEQRDLLRKILKEIKKISFIIASLSEVGDVDNG